MFIGRAYGVENSSCPLQPFAAHEYEYHGTEITSSTLKSRKRIMACVYHFSLLARFIHINRLPHPD